MPFHFEAPSISLASLPVSIAVTAVKAPDNDGHEVLRRIIFSKHFVPTYYLTLSVVILVFATAHWRKFYLRRARPVADFGRPEQRTVASSASTLLGTDSPPLKNASTSERDPLLAPASKEVPRRHAGILSRLRWSIQSFLVYQPRAIPALTAPANKLPSNATTLAILLLLGINVFYLFFRNPPTTSNLQPFADRAGFCFVANLPVLYLLAAKNNRLLLWLTGWSYEGMNIFHRRLGEWMIVLAFVHMTGMVLVWYIVLRPEHITFLYLLMLRIIYTGFGAFACFVVVWLTSIGYIRRKAYEVFLACHIVFQLAALILLFFHHRNGRLYTVMTLAIWAIDRVTARSLLLTKSLTANLHIADDRKTVLLFIDVPLSSYKFGQGICAGWQAGQHVYVSIPALGRMHRYQMHPFTIASPAPPQHKNSGTWPMQLIVRAMDGFSGELLEFANFHQHTKVFIDGPYGSTEALDTIRAADRTLLIAGGSGVSLTYPLSWVTNTPSSHADLLSTRISYVNGRKHSPRITTSPTPVSDYRHCHLWIRQDGTQQSWITLLPRHQLSTNSSTPDGSLDAFECGIDLFNKTFNTRVGLTGRPDIATEIQGWVRDKGHDTYNSRDSIVVIVCGPERLAREVRNCVARLRGEGWNIEVHVESFEW